MQGPQGTSDYHSPYCSLCKAPSAISAETPTQQGHQVARQVTNASKICNVRSLRMRTTVLDWIRVGCEAPVSILNLSLIQPVIMARHSLFKFWAASLATLSLFTPTDCTKLWPNAGALPGIIPAPCRAALTANITCSDFITAREIVNDVPINSQFLKTYCTTDCRRSLQVSRSASASLYAAD